MEPTIVIIAVKAPINARIILSLTTFVLIFKQIQKIVAEIIIVMNVAVSDPKSDCATILTGRIKERNKSTRMIAPIIRDITRNGQKFLAHAVKNSFPENFEAEPLRELKIPPEIKAFSNIPKSKSSNNPAGKDAKMPLKTEPRSPRTSISNPSCSRSFIMLSPKPDFRNPFNGNATRETISSDPNQIRRIPFHAFRVRQNPEASDLNIFIIA